MSELRPYPTVMVAILQVLGVIVAFVLTIAFATAIAMLIK